MIERGNVGFGQFTISDEEIKRTRESLGRRHDKPRRMHEGPQLQQIESRQVRIAKPLPHQRSVEENHRRLRRAANGLPFRHGARLRSEEHTSELQSLMRISYAAFCLKNKTRTTYPYE